MSGAAFLWSCVFQKLKTSEQQFNVGPCSLLAFTLFKIGVARIKRYRTCPVLLPTQLSLQSRTQSTVGLFLRSFASPKPKMKTYVSEIMAAFVLRVSKMAGVK
jgi:hypothetical protein